MTRPTASLALLHLVGNALLLFLGYHWLSVPESDAAHLTWSIFLLILFAVAGVWLHATAFVHFSRPSPVPFAARTAARNLLPLLLVLAAAIVAYALLAYWRAGFEHRSFLIGSYLTMQLRKPVPPERVLHAYWAFIWLLRWLVVPTLLLPLGSGAAAQGWRGFRSRQRHLLYPLIVCALLLCAIKLPLLLLSWIPSMPTFTLEMVSFLIRLTVAYLLFTCSLLVLERITAGSKPALTQPSTAVRP